MNGQPVMSGAEAMAGMPVADRDELLSRLTPSQLNRLLHDWEGFLARPEQLEPDGDWFVWLCLAGRGWGKTRTGAQFVKSQVDAGKARNIALIAETDDDAKKVMVEGISGLFAVYAHEPASRRPRWRKGQVVWPNGAIASLFSSYNPDGLRGPQFDLGWCDEIGKWRYPRQTWDQMQFGLRLAAKDGGRPRVVATTTPRPIELVKAIVAGEEGKVVISRGVMRENYANLHQDFIDRVERKYAGTRLGRQELDGVILSDFPNSLWKYKDLETYRVAQKPDDLEQIVVAVDPASGGMKETGPKSESDDLDEHGIIVAARSADGFGYLLDDRTCTGSPNDWAAAAILAFDDYKADACIIEINNGGDMAVNTLRTLRPGLPIRKVWASRGKHVRAEPISSLYQQGRCRHVGTFPKLEDQMALMTTNGFQGEKSPDRMDAAVWAFTALMPDLIAEPDPDGDEEMEKLLQEAHDYHVGSRV